VGGRRGGLADLGLQGGGIDVGLEAVAGDHQPVARLQLHLVSGRRHLAVFAHRLDEVVARRVVLGLLRGQFAQLDHAGHQHLVLGHLGELAGVVVVDPAVADVADQHLAVPDQQHGHRCAHALVGGAALGLAEERLS
jgi:hypothetical protein